MGHKEGREDYVLMFRDTWLAFFIISSILFAILFFIIIFLRTRDFLTKT